jgi:signal transduction histidine kinase
MKTTEPDLGDILKNLMHDVRHLTHLIRSNIELLQRQTSTQSETIPFINTAFYSTEMLSARLALVDAQLNPERFYAQGTFVARVYAKFDKAAKILRVKAKQKNVTCKLEGRTDFSWEMYPIFDLMPFVILDNAVKYSPKSYPVSISLVENKDGLSVCVESFGPTMVDDEPSQAFTKYFRGQNAKSVTDDGEGIGLFLAKSIADLHEVALSIQSGPPRTEISGVPYGTFTAQLDFRRAKR